jgi:hypothetical protein
MFALTAVSPFTVSGTGSEGEFAIVQHGYNPHLGWAFCYRDKKYNFYFYIQTKDDLPHYTLSVWYISSQLFAGGSPAIDAADANYLEQNIKRYLENVSIMSFSKVMPPNPVPAIIFTWAIRR